MVPEWLQQEVHAASDGRGKVEWIAGAHQPYFGLKVRWRQGDPRWEMVQTGRMQAANAFDLEKMFPQDCAMQDIASYVRNHWGDRNALSKHEAAKKADEIVNASVAAQSQAREAQVDAVVAKGTQHFLDESPHLRRVRAGAETAHPMVSGGLTT